MGDGRWESMKEEEEKGVEKRRREKGERKTGGERMEGDGRCIYLVVPTCIRNGTITGDPNKC